MEVKMIKCDRCGKLLELDENRRFVTPNKKDPISHRVRWEVNHGYCNEAEETFHFCRECGERLMKTFINGVRGI